MASSVGVNGITGSVQAIATNGSLTFFGGNFSEADGTVVSGVAQWDGSSWSNMNGGLSGVVSTLAINTSSSSISLYIGGSFTSPANNVVMWDGNSYVVLGNASGNGVSGNGGSVNSLAMFQNFVFVGGSFSQAYGLGGQVNNIAMWDATILNWNYLGLTNTVNGVNGPVFALAVTNSTLYVGGSFTMVNGQLSTNGVASWAIMTQVWSVLGGSSSSYSNVVNSIVAYGSDIFFGGSFSVVGGNVAANNVARWNTQSSSWFALTPTTSFPINSSGHN